MADIIITPGSSLMSFTSSLNYTQTLAQEASGSLTLQGSGSTGRTDIFTVNGNNGTLFSVSDDLSNSLFSVNTIAGLPVIEAFADNSVNLGKYGAESIVISGSNGSIQLSGSIKATTLPSAGDTNIVVFNTSSKALSYSGLGSKRSLITSLIPNKHKTPKGVSNVDFKLFWKSLIGGSERNNEPAIIGQPI